MKRFIKLFVCSALGILLSVSSVFASKPVTESYSQAPDDEFSKLYLIAGGYAQLVRSVQNSANTYAVSLGAGYHFKPSFSCELGATYTYMHLESDAKVGVGAKGVMAALAYHKTIPGDMKYIPQLEADFMTFSIDNDRFDFVGMSIAPLAFEYRASDSFLGITAGIGEFGVFYPISGFTDQTKPVYVLSFNKVSLGVVVYF